MLLPTRINVALAALGYSVISGCRRLVGKGHLARVSRAGLRWVLDLREGIDLTIYVSGYFQRGVVRACERLLGPGCVAIDIGANMGSQTLHMARQVGESGLVIAIEPTREPLARLRENLAANPELESRVRTLQVYLAAASGRDVPDFLQSSWRVTGNRSGAHPVHRGVPQETTGAKSVTLDDVVEQLKLSRIDLVKIDVDGAEDDVIAGGEKAIQRFRPNIVMEVAPYTLIERGIPGDAHVKRLVRLGYEFEDLGGRRLDSDSLDWVHRLSPGYGRDVICRHRKGHAIQRS